MNTCTTFEIVCPDEPDMENIFDKEEMEADMRDVGNPPTGENDWIEWVMFHDDIDNYFNDTLVKIVSMPEFKSGTFVIHGVEFTFKKS